MEDPKPNLHPNTLLLKGLQKQAALMLANASYLEALHPQLEHHLELRSAALITRIWIKKLQEAA